MKKIIKKHSNKNHYLLTPQGHWVRDFTRKVFPYDINNFISEKDLGQLAKNELAIKAMNVANIDKEIIRAPKIIIVSDGYKFEEKRILLKNIPRNVVIIGVNRSLVKWDEELRMDYFITNNPYSTCMTQFPDGDYIPKCIVSCRTFPDFVRRYRKNRGVVYKYVPTKCKRYGGINEAGYYIDDYRNPICAAIHLAYRWGVKKLMLFCCDDAFEGERPGAIKLPNSLYMYPQHEISHAFIAGGLYWLKHQEFHSVKVVNHSHGLEYKGIPYIKDEDIESYFK